MTAKEYEITPIIYGRLKSQGLALVCRKCKVPLEVGDVVVSRIVSSCGSYKTARYHKKCYDALFYEGMMAS